DEAVAIGVPGTGGSLRVVVAGGQGTHGGERGDVQGVDRGFGPTRDHHVGATGADDVDRVGDGFGAGRAGTDGCVCTGAGGELQGHGRRGTVGHEHGHGER